MKILVETKPEELNQDTLYVLGDRHGYNSQGVDTFHRDVVHIIAKGHYGVELSDEEVREVLGSFDNPNNIVKGLESQILQRGMDVVYPDERLVAVSVGDLVCSRKPGEMKTRNIVGKAAKEARLKGINQYVALMDLIEQAMQDPEQTDKMYQLAQKFSTLTKRRFDNLKGTEKYLNFRHLLGNADWLPSALISTVAPELATLVSIYQNSGVFEEVLAQPDVVYESTDENDVDTIGLVFVPYSTDFNHATRHFREHIKPEIKAENPHILFTHETLDTQTVGDGRNVEGRELYNYVVHVTKPKIGFSGDTHQPTQPYTVKVGDHQVDMVQVSTNDVVCYNLHKICKDGTSIDADDSIITTDDDYSTLDDDYFGSKPFRTRGGSIDD